ncbi:MAG TPA: NAD-dependent epimerase/dehydratase family protein, partial [Thermoanaerobaculia bacterium]|nr:NAD-dependent epimerase/dehydratase family protein [Thermoanaerobaculia bacterium]
VRRLVADAAPDLVINLASLVTGGRERELVLPTFHANLASAVYLLDAATDLGCHRFLQVGSLEEPEPGEPMTTPASPYAAAKWAASAYARMFHQLYQAPVVLLRLFMVYGPGQRDLGKLAPYVTLSLLRGEEPRLSSGKRPVDWVYVDDVVEGLLRAARVPGIEGQQLDLGSGKLVPVRTVVEQIYSLLAPAREPRFGTLADRPMEQVRVARATEAEEILGWRAKTPLDEGLATTVAWYRDELGAGRLAAPVAAQGA